MSSTNQKIRIIGAIAALASLALALSCRGFFVNPTWASITIQPPSPAVAVGYTQTLSAWGTDTDGNRSQITDNLVWSLSDASNGGTVATLSSAGLLTGVAVGTVTVTASSEGISATATATVAEEVATMTITPPTESVTDDGTQYATFTVTSGSSNITSLVTLTPYQNGSPVTSGISCGYQLVATDGFQDCSVTSGLVQSGSQTFSIVVTYAGYTGTSQVAATLTVNAQ